MGLIKSKMALKCMALLGVAKDSPGFIEVVI
jgi:hypothetical protein